MVHLPNRGKSIWFTKLFGKTIIKVTSICDYLYLVKLMIFMDGLSKWFTTIYGCGESLKLYLWMDYHKWWFSMAMCNQWVFLCLAAIRKGPPKNTAFLQAQTALFIPVHVILFSTIDLFFFELVRLHPLVISGNNWLYCNWYLILWQQSLVITSYIYILYVYTFLGNPFWELLPKLHVITGIAEF